MLAILCIYYNYHYYSLSAFGLFVIIRLCILYALILIWLLGCQLSPSLKTIVLFIVLKQNQLITKIGNRKKIKLIYLIFVTQLFFFNVQVTALLYVCFFSFKIIYVKNQKNFNLQQIIVEITRQILSPSVFEGPFRCSKLCQFTS